MSQDPIEREEESSSSIPVRSLLLQTLQQVCEPQTTVQLLDTKTPYTWSHYYITPEIQQYYNQIRQSVESIHATSTKYTLLCQLPKQEDSQGEQLSTSTSTTTVEPLRQELLQACQSIIQAATQLGDESTGCATCTRQWIQKRTVPILQAVLQLIQYFEEITNHVRENENQPSPSHSPAAQATGRVWDACENFKLTMPVGNRNAVRRTFMTYVQECNETIQEFQSIIDEGPAASSINSIQRETTATDENDTSWDDFLQNEEEQLYTEEELSVAIPALALIKCSRGAINLTLKVLEHTFSKNNTKTYQRDLYERMTQLFEQTRRVGDGMTDLGSVLYPPLEMESLQKEAQEQTERINAVLESVHGLSNDKQIIEQYWNHDLTATREIGELNQKLLTAIETRKQQIQDAVKQAT